MDKQLWAQALSGIRRECELAEQLSAEYERWASCMPLVEMTEAGVEFPRRTLRNVARRYTSLATRYRTMEREISHGGFFAI